MGDNTQDEFQDLPTPDANESVEEIPQELETGSEGEQSQPDDNSVEYWKQRATKAEESIVRKKQATKATTPQTNNSQTNTQASEKPDWAEAMELRQDGYTKEQVEAIMDLGGSKALSNPVVKAGIDAMAKQARSAAATPSNSAKSAMYKQYSEGELRGMDTKKLEEILPHAE